MRTVGPTRPRCGRKEKGPCPPASLRSQDDPGRGQPLALDADPDPAAGAVRLLGEFRPYVEKDGYSPAEYGFHYLRVGRSQEALPWLRLGAQGHDASLVDPTIVDLGQVAADPVTQVVMEEPGLKELMETRARHARAAKSR